MEKSTHSRIIKIFISIATFLTLISLTTGNPCNLRKYPNGAVCVCNETYCDSYDDIALRNDNDYVIAVTSEGGHRFHVQRGRVQDYIDTLINVYNDNENQLFSLPVLVTVEVRPNYEHQKIVGFGGAFTGAVSHVLDQLPKSLQHYLYKSYYSAKDGNNFNLMRMSIGGSEFDLKPWTYAETPINDTSLSGFTKLKREDHRIIRQNKELEKVANNYNIRRIAAAWSSPRWMKDNYVWSGKNRLQPRYYKTWAKYYLRWLRLMKKENMNFWGLSTGNEPLNGIENYNIIKYLSLGFTAFDQGKWLGKYLGPMIRESEFKNIKIIGDDDQMITLPWWLREMDTGHPNSSSYVDAIGFHWYQFDVVPDLYASLAHRSNPDKLLLVTESSINPPDQLGSWKSAERYINSFFGLFHHDNQGWIISNLWLNDKGQPNYINEAANAPIMVNTTSKTEFYKNPWFYTIAHFSKFLEPGSARLRIYSSNALVRSIAYKRPDSALVIILYNAMTRPVFTSVDVQQNTFRLRIPAKTIISLMYNPVQQESSSLSSGTTESVTSVTLD